MIVPPCFLPLFFCVIFFIFLFDFFLKERNNDLLLRLFVHSLVASFSFSLLNPQPRICSLILERGSERNTNLQASLCGPTRD